MVVRTEELVPLIRPFWASEDLFKSFMHPLDVVWSLKDFDLFEVSEEFVSTEREELDFLAMETTEETKEGDVTEETELSFLDSTEFFFTAETDFDLEVLLIELRDSA